MSKDEEERGGWRQGAASLKALLVGEAAIAMTSDGSVRFLSAAAEERACAS